MKECERCGATIPTRARIEGKVRMLNSRRYCTDCSPWGARNTKQLHLPSREVAQPPVPQAQPDLAAGLRWCPRCSAWFALADFDLSRRYCRPCRRAYDRDYYRTNAKVLRAKKSYNTKVRWGVLRRKLWQYFAEHPCVDCGETDPVVLEFDHREDEVKRFNIADRMGAQRLTSWANIQAEIAKCDVRCANCHRRKTAQQQHWYTYVDGVWRSGTARRLGR